MKRLLFLLLFCSSLAQAGTATLGWDASPSAGVIGYRIYCGATTGVYNAAPVADLKNSPVMTQVTFTLVPGTYFCAATAYTATQESPTKSNEVTFVIVPAPILPPGNLRIIVIVAFDPVLNKFVASVESVVPVP